MIEAAAFIAAARDRGFAWYAGVPCSYLTPFINYVSQADGLKYVSAANEGDAVALIAGATVGGTRGVSMMQNSGLGNAVSPLTSLTWTFRLPQLVVVTWRGRPGESDEPQHRLMGPITPTMLDTMELGWSMFPASPDTIGPSLDRAVETMDRTGLPYVLLMAKDSVAPVALDDRGSVARQSTTRVVDRREGNDVDLRPTRRDALQAIVERTSPMDSVLVASTGYCGRELYAIADRANHFYMVGSMGCASTFGLGLSLARPDLRVVVVDGDGAALMRMGAFATLGTYGRSNLVHVLLDNGVHESTGGQATVSGHVGFAAIAAACGYAVAHEGDRLRVLEDLLGADRMADGPSFMRLAIRPGVPPGLPRPSISPEDVKRRLMRAIGAA